MRHRCSEASGTKEAQAEARRLLELVRLPARTADRFPRELSGGERQRIAIARAAVTQPDLIVCDEITSALDVSVQGAVIELLADLRATFKVSLLFITHDLGVVASIADRVIVLDQRADLRGGSGRARLSRSRERPRPGAARGSAPPRHRRVRALR